jgi:hypothetical protein
MIGSRTSRGAAALLLSVVAAGCAGGPAPTASTPTRPSPSSGSATASQAAPSSAPTAPGDTISGLFAVDGHTMFLECKGTGSPTVILEAGAVGDSRFAAAFLGEVVAATRTCRYDRAGLGKSSARPEGGALSAGDRADDLHALLGSAGVKGPYVLVGFSYGGMIIRMFTERHPSEVEGLVFLDATHETAWAPDSWFLEQFPLGNDGAHPFDIEGTHAELLAAGDLGDRPTIVLTHGSMNGEFERRWTPVQDALAALSSNSLHMVATESGHDIPAERPELVAESIRALVETVRGTALPACGPRFEAVGAECLAGTMSDLLATWDAQRAEITPKAGKLPPGTYAFQQDGVTITMTMHAGRLDGTMAHSNGMVETFTAEYAAVGDAVTFLWPFDWRIPRTSGVNVARWSVDPNGTLHFVQVDTEPAEGWIALPWVPTAPA